MDENGEKITEIKEEEESFSAILIIVILLVVLVVIVLSILACLYCKKRRQQINMNKLQHTTEIKRDAEGLNSVIK